MKKCVLIFDDDMETLSVSKLILEQQDFSVSVRPRCNDIIGDVAETAADIVLIDLWMPEIGGEKAVQLMKKDKDTAHIPAILFSANDEIEAVCARCGADGYLKKPFSIADLVEVINIHTGTA